MVSQPLPNGPMAGQLLSSFVNNLFVGCVGQRVNCDVGPISNGSVSRPSTTMASRMIRGAVAATDE
jgi:hypothetical protein